MDHINIAGKFMASFDVTLLFTKISLFETIDIISRDSDFPTPPASNFKLLLIMYTKDVQFQFNSDI